MKYIRHQLSVLFLWLAHKLDAGFIAQLTATNGKYSTDRDESLAVLDVTKAYESVKKYDEPSGIVYRPSVTELNKMNEDKATREAKEAVAETIRNTPEPTI